MDMNKVLRRLEGKTVKVKLLTSGGYKQLKAGMEVTATVNRYPDKGVQVHAKHYPHGLYFMNGEVEILE